jgi:hypothetical protein
LVTWGSLSRSSSRTTLDVLIQKLSKAKSIEVHEAAHLAASRSDKLEHFAARLRQSVNEHMEREWRAK